MPSSLATAGAAAAYQYRVAADPVPAAAWVALLDTIAAWPLPESILVERRLLRVARRIEERILINSDAVGIYDGAAHALEELVRPLRKTCSMRRLQPRTADPVPAWIAVLHAAGAGILGPSALLEEVAQDLLSLPPGTTLAVTVWKTAAGDESDETTVRLLGRLRDGSELQLHGAPDLGLRAALRIAGPSPVPTALLARLTAAVGADPTHWHIPAPHERIQATNAFAAGQPPAVSDDHLLIDTRQVAALLAAPDLCPAGPHTTKLIGRPWTAPLPDTGCELGRVLRPSGRLHTLKVPWSMRQRHSFVCGRTGSGKSELLCRLASEDLNAGRGLVLLDPHGDLVDRVLDLVPPDRADHVVLIDPCHPRTAAIPVLQPGVDLDVQVSRLDDAFVEIFDNGSAVLSGRWRRPAQLLLRAMQEVPGLDPSLVGLSSLLTDAHLRKGLQLALKPDSPLERQLARADRMYWDLVTSRGLGITTSAGRYALDHASRWNLHPTVANGGVILINLDLAQMGSLDASRYGRMFLRLLFGAITALGALPPTHRPDTSVIVDEAHLFAEGPVLGSMISQLRKFGAGLTLSSQAPSRLGNLLPDVLTNCATVLAMQLPDREARVFADRAGDSIAKRLPGLPRFHAVAMLDDDADTNAPLVIHPLPVLHGEPAQGARTRAQARRSYGRTPRAGRRADVDRLNDIVDRYTDMAPKDVIGRPDLTGASAHAAQLKQLVRSVLTDQPPSRAKGTTRR